MSVAFDTTVLVYPLDLDGGPKRSLARDLLRRGAVEGVLVPVQALAEYVNVLRKKLGLPREVAATAAVDLGSRYEVRGLDADGFFEATACHRDHGLQIYDAIVWATARAAGCSHLLSEDLQDGRTLGGVTFINPFHEANAELVDRLLPPIP